MAEFVKKWIDFEELRIITSKVYQRVAPEDLPELRNNAAVWAFGRNLTEDEHRRITHGLEELPESIELEVQRSPRITLRRNRSTLTMEQMGVGRRLGRVSYYQDQYSSNGVANAIIEHIEQKVGVPLPLQISRN